MIFALREVGFAYPGATGDAVVGVSMEVRAG